MTLVNQKDPTNKSCTFCISKSLIQLSQLSSSLAHLRKVIFRKREKYLYFYDKPGAPEKGDFHKKEKQYFYKKPAEPHLCSPSSLSTPLGPRKNVCVVSTIKDRLKKTSYQQEKIFLAGHCYILTFISKGNSFSKCKSSAKLLQKPSY